MSKSKKRIEVLQPVVKSTEDNLTFEKLILTCNKYLYANEFKDYELSILSQKDNVTVGIITTGHNKNLPPKKNKVTGTHSTLGIDITKENLSFGNIFLYDANLNVLFYEGFFLEG